MTLEKTVIHPSTHPCSVNLHLCLRTARGGTSPEEAGIHPGQVTSLSQDTLTHTSHSYSHNKTVRRENDSYPPGPYWCEYILNVDHGWSDGTLEPQLVGHRQRQQCE